LPEKRQNLFLSATMPKEIQKLASEILVNPVKVEVAPVSSTADTIDQSVFFVEKMIRLIFLFIFYRIKVYLLLLSSPVQSTEPIKLRRNLISLKFLLKPFMVTNLRMQDKMLE
jgi:hypothetical protein